MPRGFARLFDWLRKSNLKPAGRSLAIYYDDPAKIPAAQQRCETCVPLIRLWSSLERCASKWSAEARSQRLSMSGGDSGNGRIRNYTIGCMHKDITSVMSP